MYTELSYVNACLATMGEAPITSLDIPHPYVPAAISILARTSKFVQASRRWWFNTITVTAAPAPGDYSVLSSLPSNPLTVVGKQGEALTLNADGTLYDHNKGETMTVSQEVFVTREIPLAELPPQANNYIALSAILEFQENFDADAGRSASLTRRVQMARAELNTQQTRLMAINILARPSTAMSMHRIRGDRPMIP